jgi:IS30 family transposase
LLSGSKNSHIATLVERHSRFVSVVQSLITQMRMLDERLRKSLTWDRGQEFAAHKRFSMATNMATSVSDRLAAKTPPTRCSGT